MKTLSKIFLMTLILISSSTVAAEEEVGFRDSAIIFGTGVAVQVGAVSLITHGPTGTEPVAAIAFISTGVIMDIVGDSLGHNGNVLDRGCHIPRLARWRRDRLGGCKQRRK